jgi:hypothetical protein
MDAGGALHEHPPALFGTGRAQAVRINSLEET